MGGQVRWSAEERDGGRQSWFQAGDGKTEAKEIEGGRGGGAGCHVIHPIPRPEGAAADSHRYGGYNEQMINRFVWMGFDLDRVVSAFDYVGIDPNDGEDYELEEAYIGDITARLLGEP